ncbi:larval cuticle protein LCP-17 [Bicyclus anynana]|uniref:Larval cuticle protein LCP-17 n=1 Tax=Bicyclus anynana TaxID=110368 RepID=A0A6J1N1U5_BICAN|nr:larval cuticle protein LCP-17 [Bicyclus anynana]
MKLLIVVLLVAYASADVSHVVGGRTGEANAQIKKQELDVGVEGQYQYSYETENGISGSEQGAPRLVPGSDNPAEVVQGESRYTAPGGEVIQLSYIADENGFQPQGAHLPTSPPIPEAILRALEFIRANPPRETQN